MKSSRLALGLAAFVISSAAAPGALAVTVDFEDALGAVSDTGAISVASPVVIQGVTIVTDAGTLTNRGKDSSSVPFTSDWLEFGSGGDQTVSLTLTGIGSGSLQLGASQVGFGGCEVSFSCFPACTVPASVVLPGGESVVTVGFDLGTAATTATLILSIGNTFPPIGRIGIDNLTHGSEAVCGNSELETGEQCDDGNTQNGDGCSDLCRNEFVCGDGDLDPAEECDDGNQASGDGCSSICLIEILHHLDFEDAFGPISSSQTLSASSPIELEGVQFSTTQGSLTNRGSDTSAIPFDSDWIEFGAGGDQTLHITVSGMGPGTLRLGSVLVGVSAELTASCVPACLVPGSIALAPGENISLVSFDLGPVVQTATVTIVVPALPPGSIVGIDDFEYRTGVLPIPSVSAIGRMALCLLLASVALLARRGVRRAHGDDRER